MKRTRDDIKPGTRFGHWTVLDIPAYKASHSVKMYHCQCDCGKKLAITESNLLRKFTEDAKCRSCWIKSGKFKMLAIAKKKEEV